MSSTMHVKPAPGLLIRNPQRDFAPLPPEGAHVPLDGYWLKLKRDGDVIESAPAADPKPPTTAKK